MQHFVKSNGCPKGTLPGPGEGEECAGHGTCERSNGQFLFLEINQKTKKKFRKEKTG